MGSGLSINSSGVLSNSYSYSLPTASSTTLGGVKVGSGLSINSSGVLSANVTSTDNLGDHTASQNIQLNDKWLSNDGNNEGIRIDNSGKVGIGETNPAAKLEVAGASIIGWNGNPDYIYISPFELKPSNDNGNWEFTNSDGGNSNTSSSDWSYGGQVRYYYGSDGYFSFFIPYGYKMTGYDFYFGNYPSDIKVYTSGISGFGVTIKDTYDPGSGYGTATQSEDNNTFNSINSSSSYVIIHFINDPTDQFLFKGGRIRIARQ